MDAIPKGVTTSVRLRSLLQELSVLTGVPEADALLAALEERVARLKGPVSREERIGRALQDLESSPRPSRARPVPDRRQRDRALGYGKEGV
jgi:hypothetical protein